MVYSGIETGNMSTARGPIEEVKANRARLLSPLNPDRFVIQIPRLGGDFVDLSPMDEADMEEEYSTDGLFVDRPGIALELHPADCIAMVLYSEDSPVIGLMHAGRQGVDAGIHANAIAHMTGEHGVPVDEIQVYFGPSISQDSYFYPYIPAEQLADPKWNKFIDKRGGNHHVDLQGRVVKDLADFAIDPAQIEICPVDVGADPAYFSHSRSNHTGEPEGRNGFAAMGVE